MITERQEVITPTEKRMECQEGDRHRLLARANMWGIMLFCPDHKRAHLVTWDEIERLRAEFRPKLVLPLEEQVS